MAENEFDPAAAPNGADNAPQIGLIAQYVKDLSFENPNSPAIYQSQGQLRFEIQINVGTNPAADDVHEVAMKLDVRALDDNDAPAYVVELLYAGLFGVRNVSPEQLQPFLYAEAPRLLFPFARRIIAETVRDGNFPPMLLEPIDFGAMYMHQLQQAQGLATGEPAGEA